MYLTGQGWYIRCDHQRSIQHVYDVLTKLGLDELPDEMHHGTYGQHRARGSAGWGSFFW